MTKYETIFVVNSALGEEAVKALVEKFTTLIGANAEVETVNEWGKRRLAYPINYVTEGYYVLVSYKSEPSFPLELERVLGITEGVLRYMTTTKIEKAAKAEEVVEEAADEAAGPEAEDHDSDSRQQRVYRFHHRGNRYCRHRWQLHH